jgi:lactoylglutathione lyase
MKDCQPQTRAHRPTALLHTMLRVGNLQRSLAFYVDTLGMTLFRREAYPGGRFTLAFVGYGDEESSAAIELTHNWETDRYEHGTAFGHLALKVANAAATCERLAAAGVPILRAPGPMKHSSEQRDTSEVIAFVADPDGHRIELIELELAPSYLKHG